MFNFVKISDRLCFEVNVVREVQELLVTELLLKEMSAQAVLVLCEEPLHYLVDGGLYVSHVNLIIPVPLER